MKVCILTVIKCEYIEEDEEGEACEDRGKNEKLVYFFFGKSEGERCVVWRIILK